MKPTWGLVAALAVCSVALGGDVRPEQVAAMLREYERAKEITREQLRIAEAALEEAEAIVVPPGAGKRSKWTRQSIQGDKNQRTRKAEKVIAEAKEKLDLLERMKAFPIPSPLFVANEKGEFVPLDAGEVGHLANVPIHVLQVTGPDTAIVRIGGYVGGEEPRRYPDATVVMRLDTEKLVDDMPLKFGETQYFSVTGPVRYRSLLGDRTVHEVEKVDMDAAIQAIKKALAKK